MKFHPLCKTLIFFLFCVFSSVSGKVFSEKSILLELKKSLSDPSGILSSWKVNDSDHCSWFGVSCDSNSRVSSLNITGGGGHGGMLSQFPFHRFGVRRTCSKGKLVGNLLKLIGELTELRVLSLAYHDLSGEIPGEIWGLEKLEVLDLEGNMFTGKLPNRITGLRKLLVLNLGFNGIYGKIPFSLSICRNLQVLNLAGNRMNGKIPGFLGTFSKLKGLYLSHNWFSGSFPVDFGRGCQNLEHLDVSGNFLNGRIPGSLGNCWQLQTLLLYSNMFDGVIPSELGQLRNLEVLDVSRNGLRGPLPAELGNCTELSVFVLKNLFDPLPKNRNWRGGPLVELPDTPKDDSNSFGGSIPMKITTLPKLRIVWAPGAAFQGNLPGNWGACESLEVVNLAQNHLSGEIDGVFRGCKNLHFLDLSSNSLTGNLDEMIPVPCMTHFDISRNLLSGLIPKFHYRVCPSMRVEAYSPSFAYLMFYTKNTSFRTPLPFSGAKFTIIHNFGGNNFTGSIERLPIADERLGKHTDYAFLTGGNKHTGSFPRSLFGKCDKLNGMIANFSNNNIDGHIPVEIGVMCRSLRLLDASKNQISGPVPCSLGDLESLIFLDLSENNLQGQIPTGLSRSKFLNYLSLAGNNLTEDVHPSSGQSHSLEVLDLDSNSNSQEIPWGSVKLRKLTSSVDLDNNNGDSQNNATSPSGSGYNSIEIASIASASAIVSVLLALVILLCYTRKHTPKSRVQVCELREITVFNDIGVPLTFENIVRATGNFNASNCIGNGGFGVTYKAEISPGTLVAVKRLSVGRFHGVQQFHAEIKTLGTVTHSNLVTLIGYHASETEMFLIYNYLPGGNLENFIKERSAKAIDWKILHKIALDVARALAYLHEPCDTRVVHRDVKPSNILLDNDCNAYLSDFGLSRLLGTSETHATTGVAGTFGYLAPEYAMTCRVSEKSDVYSYGVVLMELISDKKALDPSFSSQGNGFNIVSWACMMMREGQAKEVFTAGLWETGPHDALVDTLHLAIMCTVDSLSIRPTMKQVVKRLKQIQQLGNKGSG